MTLNEPKTYGQFIQTDFLQKIVAYELNSGHVLIFYPTQVKLSGISGQFFNRELKTG